MAGLPVAASRDSPDPQPTAFVPFSPNVRVNSGGTGYSHQVEPTMVFNSQGRIFVGWKEAFTATGGGQRVAFSYSADGGSTWAPNVLMNLASLTLQSDPWLSVTPADRVDFTRIEYASTSQAGGITVTSTADGVIWGPDRFYSDAPNFADKESAASDSSGGLYWLWNSDNVATGRQDLAFTRSLDAGVTWAPKVLVNDFPGGLGGIVQVAANGTVLATWWDYTRDNIAFDRSPTGGATWGTDRRANAVSGSAVQTGTWIIPLPAMAVSPNGTIYVTWMDGGAGNEDIVVANSTDGGTTWSAPVRVNDDAGTSRQWMPDLAVDPFGGVHLAWEDDRNGAHDIYYANSTDGGATWGPNVRVTEASTPLTFTRPGDYLAIESDRDGTVGIVWTDGRGTDQDIYFAKLTRTVLYTVSTSPPGLQVVVDSQTYTAPVTFSWPSGGVHSVSTPTPQPVTAQTRRVFGAWNDGGGLTHVIQVPLMGGTIVATFETEHLVTFSTAPVALSVSVDATTLSGGGQFWWLEGSTHVLDAPSPQTTAPGIRYVFDRWTDAGPQSRTVTVSEPAAYAVDFHVEYLLTVASAHGNPIGSGWFPANANAPFSVEEYGAGPSGTRFAFTGWTGDFSASANASTVVMNGPKAVTAGWRTEHLLTVESEHGTPLGAGWYPGGDRATVAIESEVTVNGTTYRFVGWSGDETGIVPTIEVVMDAPKTLVAVWEVVPATSAQPATGAFPAWLVLLALIGVAFLLLVFFLWRRRKKDDEAAPPPPK